MNHVDRGASRRHTQGFTLIELMLAMTFISILLIAIALAVIQMTGTYNRGLALKEVNQLARSVSDSLRSTAAAGSHKLASNEYVATTAGGNGRLCLGTYTYIWNTARAFQGDTNADPIRFDGAPSRKIQLVRVPDPSRIYCIQPTGTLVNKNIRAIDASATQELIDPGEHKLALSKLELAASPAVDSVTGSALYTLNYTIIAGDLESMDISNPNAYACRPPATAGANINYCVVQPFSIVLRI